MNWYQVLYKLQQHSLQRYEEVHGEDFEWWTNGVVICISSLFTKVYLNLGHTSSSYVIIA